MSDYCHIVAAAFYNTVNNLREGVADSCGELLVAFTEGGSYALLTSYPTVKKRLLFVKLFSGLAFEFTKVILCESVDNKALSFGVNDFSGFLASFKRRSKNEIRLRVYIFLFEIYNLLSSFVAEGRVGVTCIYSLEVILGQTVSYKMYFVCLNSKITPL